MKGDYMLDVLKYVETDAEYRTIGEGKRNQDPNTGNIPDSQEKMQVSDYLFNIDGESANKLFELLSKRYDELKKELDAYFVCSASFNKDTVEYKKLFSVQVSIGTQLYIINNELLPSLSKKIEDTKTKNR